jgi:hypothetical protein
MSHEFLVLGSHYRSSIYLDIRWRPVSNGHKFRLQEIQRRFRHGAVSKDRFFHGFLAMFGVDRSFQQHWVPGPVA